MLVSDFDYDLPPELIAQQPLEERDASRMLVVPLPEGPLEHRHVRDLPNFLARGDLLVFNDSRVIPARLFGARGNGEKLEVLVVEPQASGSNRWRCLLKRARRMRDGEQIFFGMQATAKVCGREEIYLILEFPRNTLELAMKHHGVPPLPPYIERDGFTAYTENDRDRYQTVYADVPGSAAAPTAGLHFSHDLLEQLTANGIERAHVTLHVGIDTFTPVREDVVENHRMHGERVTITREHAERIAQALNSGRRVIAVGTTSARALESAVVAAETGTPSIPAGKIGIAYGSWTTEIFILPGYRFQTISGMLTNFHQPKSTLLMMVSAFAGRDRIRTCYDEAIRERYRFFSYGDCMLILAAAPQLV